MAVYKCDSCGTIWAANDVPIACVKFGCGSRLVTEIQGATPAAETPPPPPPSSNHLVVFSVLAVNLTAILSAIVLLLLAFFFRDLIYNGSNLARMDYSDKLYRGYRLIYDSDCYRALLSSEQL